MHRTVGVRASPSTKVLRQVSGVGPVTALSLVLTLDSPSRVSDSQPVGPYLGLVPRTHDSGASSPQLRNTKALDPGLRRLLVIAANRILGPFGPDCDLDGNDPPRTGFAWRNHGTHVNVRPCVRSKLPPPHRDGIERYQHW